MSGCCKSWNSQGISSLEFPSFIPKKLTRSVCSWAAWLEKSLGDCWHSWQTWEIWEKKEQNSQFLTFWRFFYALNPAPCTPRGCRDWLQSWIKRRLEGEEKGFPHILPTFQLVWNGFLHPLEFTATDPSWNAPDFPGKNLPKSGIEVGFRRQNPSPFPAGIGWSSPRMDSQDFEIIGKFRKRKNLVSSGTKGGKAGMLKTGKHLEPLWDGWNGKKTTRTSLEFPLGRCQGNQLLIIPWSIPKYP